MSLCLFFNLKKTQYIKKQRNDMDLYLIKPYVIVPYFLFLSVTYLVKVSVVVHLVQLGLFQCKRHVSLRHASLP